MNLKGQKYILETSIPYKEQNSRIRYLRGRRELEKGSQQKYIADSQLVSLAPLAPCMRQITATSTGLMVIITPDLISHYLANIATLKLASL